MLRSLRYMLTALSKKIFGTWTDSELKKILPLIQLINQRENQYRKMSDETLKAQTQVFKEKLSQGAKLDDKKRPLLFAGQRQSVVRWHTGRIR